MTDNDVDSFGPFRRRAPEPVKLAEGFIKLSLDELNDPDLFYPLVTPTNQSRAFGARGLCRIYNQRDFKVQTGQSRRDGTDADADGVEKLFRKLNYSTETYLNSDYNEMMRTLKSAASVDHSNYDSFVCVILSHGVNGQVFTSDRAVSVDAIVDHFRGDRCHSLVGKPKIFIIQACRGTALDPGAHVPMVPDAVGDLVISRLPVEADILMAYSTVPGYFAWRNSFQGSWFIQELCRVLGEDSRRPVHHHHDVLTLLTVVARCVACRYQSRSAMPDFNSMLQMTSTYSTLTRLAYITGPPRAAVTNQTPL